MNQEQRAARTDLVRAKVTGFLPVEDYVTREPVAEGGIVTLAPRLPNRPPLPRECLIDALVQAGCIELVADEPKAKAEPKARG